VVGMGAEAAFPPCRAHARATDHPRARETLSYWKDAGVTVQIYDAVPSRRRLACPNAACPFEVRPVPCAGFATSAQKRMPRRWQLRGACV
jgi:hypothetical protein